MHLMVSKLNIAREKISLKIGDLKLPNENFPSVCQKGGKQYRICKNNRLKCVMYIELETRKRKREHNRGNILSNNG